jgi:hypothetical protein
LRLKSEVYLLSAFSVLQFLVATTYPPDAILLHHATIRHPTSRNHRPLPRTSPQDKYASGDPCLAYVDEEAENPPLFSDPYEERAYLKHRLALAFRVFAKHGLAEGVAGHITLRDPVDPTSFWVNPFGTHFSLIRDGDLIRVDHDGKIVEGEKNKRLNYGEFNVEAISINMS